MTEKPTVEEMQNWNKKYKLDIDCTTVIDTIDGGEYWTVHPNEAYNLCIELNKLYDENEQLKKVLSDVAKDHEVTVEDLILWSEGLND